MALSSNPDEMYVTNLKAMRILLFALIAGVVMFLTITLFALRAGKTFAPHPWQITMPMGLVALLFAVMAVALSFVVPQIQATGMIQKMSRGELPLVGNTEASKAERETFGLIAIAQAKMILGAALLEGAAFFNVIVYMLEGGAIPLITTLILIGLIASRFPTRSGLENWVEDRRQELQQG